MRHVREMVVRAVSLSAAGTTMAVALIICREQIISFIRGDIGEKSKSSRPKKSPIPNEKAK